MSQPASSLAVYFDEPRLSLSFGGRILVRVVSNLAYFLALVSAAAFFISDLAWMRWLSVLLLLFLADRLFHSRAADKPLTELPSAGKVNLAVYLSPGALAVVERAFDRSAFTRESFRLELVRVLLRRREIKEALRRLDVSPEEFLAKTEDLLQLSRAQKESKLDRLSAAEALIGRAFQYALAEKHEYIEAHDLFAVLPSTADEFTRRLFDLFEIAAGDLEQAIIFGTARRHLAGARLPQTLSGILRGRERVLRQRIMNRAWTSRPTPALDRLSRDLTDLARQRAVGFLIGHEAEYERLEQSLSRPVNPNAILVGEAGVGKETIVAHLALEMIKDRVPPPLFDKRLVELSLASLVAGAAPEELHRRLQQVAEEIVTAGNIVLYIPEIHNLMSTSGTAYLSAADALLPILRAGRFPVIGTTYSREYKQVLERRSDFLSAFETIRVAEISPAEAEKVLIYDSLLLEKETKVFISFGAIRAAVRLAYKHLRDKQLPASAEELLKNALTAVLERGGRTLGPNDVVRAAEEQTNVPLRAADAAEAAQLLNLEKVIHERLVDQVEAVRAVADSLREYRAGLSRSGGPIAAFLFVGPTGVGKTELAKILARIQFGAESNMVRFDMTEYQDKQSFFRLIGSPDGQIDGALTAAVREKPYSLILLDEFEKAYPDILDLFLQVFDDARLTDNLGRVVDFRNTIIIATSNAHSEIINRSLAQGETIAQIGEYLKRKLVDVFKPELLNRFTKTVIFRDLSFEDVEKIAAINLRELAAKAGEQNIRLEFDPAAVRQIARLGYDPAFGARPLRKAIDEHLRAPLAQAILGGRVKNGGGLHVVWNGESFQFVSTSVFVEKT